MSNDLDQFKNLNYPIVKDKFEGFLGPLAGIHASILWTKTELIFFLPKVLVII